MNVKSKLQVVLKQRRNSVFTYEMEARLCVKICFVAEEQTLQAKSWRTRPKFWVIEAAICNQLDQKLLRGSIYSHYKSVQDYS